MSEKKIISIDPRVNRESIPDEFDTPFQPKEELDQFSTFEVFHQQKSGGRHVHVGSVHAPSHDLALAFAKEQYGRRGQTLNLWIVKTQDVLAMEQDDSDIFETSPLKDYREVTAYVKVREKVEEYKKRLQAE